MAVLEAPPKDESNDSPATAVENASGMGGRYPSLGVPPLPLPPQPRRRPPTERLRSLPVVLAGLSILLLMVVGIVVMMRPAAPSGVPKALRRGGTIISVRSTNGGELAIRVPTGGIVDLPMTGKRLETGDGWELALASVRPADSVVLRSAAVVVDSAQRRANVSGIVEIAPDPDGDVMTVQLSPAHRILVDIGGQTRINGRLPSVASRMSILQADQVRVVGILDVSFDEMTQTRAIDRIGPDRTPSSAAAAPDRRTFLTRRKSGTLRSLEPNRGTPILTSRVRLSGPAA